MMVVMKLYDQGLMSIPPPPPPPPPPNTDLAGTIRAHISTSLSPRKVGQLLIRALLSLQT
jgi:hypothetical protein